MDSWIVHAWEVFDLWIVHAWEVFDLWIVHVWEVFDSWIVPAQSLKNREVFQIGPKYFVQFFDTVLLSAHVERVSVSRMRDFSYPSYF